MKRVRKYKDNPNPLFEKWLEEFRQEQLTRDPDSPVHFSYTKALTSLRKCPVTLPNGKACRALKNFGEKICTMLDKRLERYNAEHGIVVQQEDADVLPDAGEARRAPKVLIVFYSRFQIHFHVLILQIFISESKKGLCSENSFWCLCNLNRIAPRVTRARLPW